MRVSLKKVRLNAGGYDSDGRYFGHVAGLPLWYYSDDYGNVWGHVRGRDRDEARREVMRKFPTAIIRRGK